MHRIKMTIIFTAVPDGFEKKLWKVTEISRIKTALYLTVSALTEKMVFQENLMFL